MCLTSNVWQVLHQQVVDHGEAAVSPLTDGKHIAQGAVQRGHLSDVATFNVLPGTALTRHVPNAATYPEEGMVVEGDGVQPE